MYNYRYTNLPILLSPSTHHPATQATNTNGNNHPPSSHSPHDNRHPCRALHHLQPSQPTTAINHQTRRAVYRVCATKFLFQILQTSVRPIQNPDRRLHHQHTHNATPEIERKRKSGHHTRAPPTPMLSELLAGPRVDESPPNPCLPLDHHQRHHHHPRHHPYLATS
ncbi:leucine-rich repeat extensin-like protein 3 [Iris pallida]|uniref:Leucine-rich repeat extensin-like protein 3 n=1 Tax=Iris pallida TaxID=29817 RepID=A0AAX6I8X2_IRIPA|nr:leucine-rich repeat extensin-like protein 3 [Iris pallida]